MLYNCLEWYTFVNTHLYHSRQLYNIHVLGYSVLHACGGRPAEVWHTVHP